MFLGQFEGRSNRVRQLCRLECFAVHANDRDVPFRQEVAGFFFQHLKTALDRLSSFELDLQPDENGITDIDRLDEPCEGLGPGEPHLIFLEELLSFHSARPKQILFGTLDKAKEVGMVGDSGCIGIGPVGLDPRLESYNRIWCLKD